MDPTAILQASKRHASGLAFAPDGKTLVTGGMEGALKVWRAKDWSLGQEVAGHTASVNSIEHTATGCVTAGSDKTIRVWDRDWHQTHEVKGYVACAAVEGALILRKDRGDRLYRHDVAAGKATAAAATGFDRLHGPWATPAGVAVSGGSPDLQIRAWTDLSPVATLGGHGTAVTGVSCTRDGRTIAVSDYEGRVHLWDARTLRRKADIQLGPKGYFFAAIRPDGKRVAAAGEGVVGVYTLDGDVVWTFKPGIKGVYGVAWSGDGKHLANAASDGRVRVWALSPQDD